MRTWRNILAPAAVLAAFLLCAAEAPGASLRVRFPDGLSETIPVAVLDGVAYLRLQSLSRLCRRVDAGATLNYQYDPNDLRIFVAGKTVHATQSYTVIDERITVPTYPPRVEGGEFFVPLETVEEIRAALGLFEMTLDIGEPSFTGLPLPPDSTLMDNVVDLGRPAPFVSTPDVALPPPSEPSGLEGPSPASWDPEVLLSLPEIIPREVREIASTDLATLLERAAMPEFGRIALAPEAGLPAIHGEFAETVDSVTRNVASRLRDRLEATGCFSVQLPDQPVRADAIERTLEWANSTQCDALVALTVDISGFRDLKGMRIYTAHEAGDPSSRPIEKGGAYGLRPGLNYVPWQDHSLLLAGLIHDDLGRSETLNVHPVQIAPSFLLRRLTMPAALVSLGYATTESERARMVEEDFSDEIALHLTNALLRMRERNRRAFHGS
jgi:hypothetical protein